MYPTWLPPEGLRYLKVKLQVPDDQEPTGQLRRIVQQLAESQMVLDLARECVSSCCCRLRLYRDLYFLWRRNNNVVYLLNKVKEVEKYRMDPKKLHCTSFCSP